MTFKNCIYILTVFFTSLTISETLPPDVVFKNEVHPYLKNTCFQCHGDNATEPAGPLHSVSEPTLAYPVFKSRMSEDNVEASLFYRYGRNGHYCNDFNKLCDESEQIKEDLDRIIKEWAKQTVAYNLEQEKKLDEQKKLQLSASLSKKKHSVAMEGGFQLEFNITRIENSDLFLLDNFVLKKSLSKFSFLPTTLISGIELTINGKAPQKLIGIESLEFIFNEKIFTERPLGHFRTTVQLPDSVTIGAKFRSTQSGESIQYGICNPEFENSIINNSKTYPTLHSILQEYTRNIDNIGKRFQHVNNNQMINFLSCQFLMSHINFDNFMTSPLVNIGDGQMQSIPYDELNKVFYEITGFKKIPDSWYVSSAESQITFFSEEEKGAAIYSKSGCINCHGSSFNGGLKFDTPLGKVTTPALVNNMSRSQFEEALTSGTGLKGQHLSPLFPYTSYRFMSEEDKDLLFQFITGASLNSSKAEDLSWGKKITLQKNNVAIASWKALDDSEKEYQKIQDQANNPKGAYLAIAIGHCAECHTPRSKMGHLNFNKFMKGAKVPAGKVNGKDTFEMASDLTSSKKNNPANWSKAEYIQFLKTGKTPNGSTVIGKMDTVVKNQTSLMSEKELSDLVDYLKSL